MFGRLALHASDGSRLTIEFALSGRFELRARPRAASRPFAGSGIRLRDIAKHGRSFRPLRTAGISGPGHACVADVRCLVASPELNVVENGRLRALRGQLSWIRPPGHLGPKRRCSSVLGFELISRGIKPHRERSRASKPVSQAIDPVLVSVDSIPMSRPPNRTRVSALSARKFGPRTASRSRSNRPCPATGRRLELLRKHMDTKAQLRGLREPEFA